MDRDAAAAVLLASAFQTVERLTHAAPAEQAEIMSSARAAYERTPLGTAQLQYALLLAAPGAPGRDASAARRLLRALVAQPESLSPGERAAALVELAHLEREFDLQSDSDRLQSDLQKSDRDHQAQAQRRLQGEQEENTRLRKQLDEALAKLDAVANIERKMTTSKSDKEAHAP